MAHSFDNAIFRQLSTDHRLAVWSMSGGFVIKKIPGSADNVIQVIGPTFPRMTMPIQGTAAQMTALLGKVGTSGSLVFHFETTNARLLSMEPPVSIGIDNDFYTSSLTFIRSASFTAPTPTHTHSVQYNHSTIDDGSGMTDISDVVISFVTHHDIEAECGTCELTLSSYPSGIVVNDHFVINIDSDLIFNGRLARPAVQYFDQWVFYLEDIGANLRFLWGGEGSDPELDALLNRVYESIDDDVLIVNIFEALGGGVGGGALHSIPTTGNPLATIYPITLRVGQSGWSLIRGDQGIDIIYGMWTSTTNDGVLRRAALQTAIGADFTAYEGVNILAGSSRSPLGTESIINRFIVYGLEYEGATIGGVGVGDYALTNSNIPTPPTSHSKTIRNNLIEDDATALACATTQVGLHNFPEDNTNLILLGDTSITIGQTVEIASTGALGLDHNFDLRFVSSCEHHYGAGVGYEVHCKCIRTE